MTIAEQLKQSFNVEKEIPWLREAVLNDIKNQGYWTVICDTHINEIKESALPNKYFTPIYEWAKKEGLNAYPTYNSYGVRSIEITM